MTVPIAELPVSAVSAAERLCIPTMPDELWWGGKAHDGVLMPFGDFPYCCDLRRELGGNQGAPLLLSNQGRSVWSPEPFEFEFEGRGSGLIVRGDLSKLVILSRG